MSEEKQKQKISIGIDLGTTNSAVAYVNLGQSHIVENSLGHRTTPSFVYIDKSSKSAKVGVEAKRLASKEPQNVFSSFKRLIGMPYKDLKQIEVSYTVFADAKGMASCKDSNGEECDPIFLSSRVLKYLKDSVEGRLNCEVESAVITVPAYFNNSQREATIVAGEQAGLKVLKILNEPTAAALAAVDTENTSVDQQLLVYDFGGGTFDVSVITYDAEAKIYQVNATNGDTQLGGKDFDQTIYNWADSYIRKDTGKSVANYPRAIYELQEAVEVAKKQLSEQSETVVTVPYFGADLKDKTGEPYSLELKLTRVEFEEMIREKVNGSLKIVEQTLKEANLSKKDIVSVILVGGSTRIPLVQDSLAGMFGKDKINMRHNPDEIVALGAGIEAAIRTGRMDKDISLLDVTPLAIGIETLGGAFTPIVEKNKAYPVSQSQVFSTAEDNQTAVTLKIWQGDRPIANKNHHLGTFELSGIAAKPKGIPQIEVTFHIDNNGVLEATAKDMESGKKQSVRIESRLDQSKVRQMQEEAMQFKESDEKYQNYLVTKVDLMQSVATGRKTLEDQFKEQDVHIRYLEAMDKADVFVQEDKLENSEEMNTLSQEIHNLHTEYLRLKSEKEKPEDADADKTEEPADTDDAQENADKT